MSDNQPVQFIAENIAKVNACICRACDAAGRRPDEVTLIAVSKTISAEFVKAAMACGIRHFGENRVQEAKEKIPLLPPATWHLIGSLQTNKVKSALTLFSYIHSVDRPSLVETLARMDTTAAVPVLMQVNVAGEATKQGVALDEAVGLARRICVAGLKLSGLMTIAPQANNPEDVRPVFRSLRQLQMQLQDLALPGADLGHLSMGMSGDYPVAIEEGATLIRVGSAIFGPRASSTIGASGQGGSNTQ